MIYMRNMVDGSFVKSITGECVDWTDAKVDAFDFDTMPSDKEKAEFQDMILAAGVRIPLEFVEA